MTPDPIASDAQARELACDVTRSFLLQAPAGSGKTTVLVTRYLALLARVDEPEAILAVTFTRKAAGEMAARILDALGKAARDPASVDQRYRAAAVAAVAHAGRRGWDLLANPARLRIQTLDSLNHWLASQLPVTAGSGGPLQVQPDARPLYQRAARRCLQAVSEEEGEVGAAAQLLFVRLDNSWQRLESLLAAMLAERAHWLPHVLAAGEPRLVARVEESLASLTARQLGNARGLLGALQGEEAVALARLAARQLAELPGDAAHDWEGWTQFTVSDAAQAAPLGDAVGELPRWRALAQLVLTRQGRWRKSINKRVGFPPGDGAAKQRMLDWLEAAARVHSLEQVLDQLREWPDLQLSGEDVQGLRALSLLLRRAVAELQLVFAAQGAVDYSYVAGAARAALSEEGLPTELALRCGGALRHILVDEFQDTSAEQFHLLAALCAGWAPGDGRTLFVVGDPMQSIYQFREAQVGLFLRARALGIGGLSLAALQLTRNFRSSAEVVAWINARFALLFPQAEDQRRGAVPYAASASGVPGEPVRGPGATAAVCAHAWLEVSADDVAAAEAQRIVELVRDARRRDAGCSIAVLFASRTRAPVVAAALQSAGIPVRGIRMDPLGERPVVRDLIGLARALQHPLDRTAWLSVLGAPWCGLGLAQLERIFSKVTTSVWEVLATEEAAPVRRLCRALAPALEGAARGAALWQRVESCWYRLGGPACCSDARALQDAADYIAALAADADSALRAGEALATEAGDLYSRAAAQPGAVELLTVHGAKGLEWDVVLLPGLGARARNDTEPLLNWIDLPGEGERSELLLAPISLDAGRKVSGDTGALIRRLRRERQQLEQVRLWYVAATRARSELHLLGQLVAGEAGPQPRSGSPLAMLWPALADEFLAALPAGTPAAAAGSGAAAALAEPQRSWRLAEDWQPAALPAPLHIERLETASIEAAARPEYSWVGATARAIGTIVHAELQRFAQLPELPSAAGLQHEARDYGLWLASHGVPAAERPAAGARIAQALQAALRDARGRWLLQQHRSAASELRLSGRVAGRIEHLVIDRTFIDEQGQRWVVDFKTSLHEGGAREAFLDSEVLRYTPQLQRYATLLRHAGPEPLRAALYFPLLQAWREVPL
ncbi:MAG TPA: UvrD-helicase domain-containing protein [Steroidobacteraceae bacterium]|nr:UvrD-helicase domain-containing protein [Steroidobacteraceae bacterium]